MTQRKPPAMRYSDWIELQIRDAQRQGAFEDLPGAGEPIPDIDTKRGELDWIAGYLRKENVDPSALLPASLTLAKEVEDLPVRLARERSEDAVRALIEDLNLRIRAARLAPQDGPPLRARPVDIEAAVLRWRADRASQLAARTALAAVPAAPPPASDSAVETAGAPSPPPPRRRWGRRSIRRAGVGQPGNPQAF
ncbi:MAG: DUF1992 domain-containing protein [Frankiaceae bacterium]|jgi:hypothetical protein|nr:DUF1992 domain-containing protein [Frankiaceae bacterium]